MPVWPVTLARGGVCSMSLWDYSISDQGAWDSRVRGRREKEYALVIEQKSFGCSLLRTCLQVPTAGITFSQEPGLMY